MLEKVSRVAVILQVAVCLFIGGIAQTPVPISKATSEHCSQSLGNPYNRTVACQVWNGDTQRFSEPLQIEIAYEDGTKRTIDSPFPIREWHFWDHARQLVIHSAPRSGIGTYFLYNVSTLQKIETLPDTITPASLPQWAKSQWQLDDESVPAGDSLSQQRTLWIAKVLRQIQTLHPGMKRSDVFMVMHSEGGLSTRFQQTLVSRECPYIKVDFRFKAPQDDGTPGPESPDDLVEFVSKPYLDWSIAD